MVTEMTLADLIARDGRVSSSGSDSSSLLSGSSSSSSSGSSSSSDSNDDSDSGKAPRRHHHRSPPPPPPAEPPVAAMPPPSSKTVKSKRAPPRKSPATAAPKAPSAKSTPAKKAEPASKRRAPPSKGKKGTPKAATTPRRAKQTPAAAPAFAESVDTTLPPPLPSHRVPVLKSASSGTIHLTKGEDPGVSGTHIPSDECRGKIELGLVDPSKAEHAAVTEIKEDQLDATLFNVHDDKGDVLRNLDMFYFCDEAGSPISLDIFELPRDQRPVIMGFGTVIQPLPVSELPPPIRYYMPDIVPSSRKRKKSRKPAGASGKRRKPATAMVNDDSSEDDEGDASSSDDDKDTATPRSDDDANKSLDQLDGAGGGGGAPTHGVQAPSTRFASFQYSYGVKRKKTALGQVDGAVSGDVSSSSSSDSDDSSSDSSSSSSSNDMRGIQQRGDVSMTGHADDSGSDTKPIRATKKPPPAPDAAPAHPSSASSSYCKVHDMTPKVAGADLDDLMRADGVHSVSVQGNAEELDLLECGFRYPPTCARQRVWLPEISDWCLDYTDGDPTLWVITSHAWYKIAGPISGVLPHWSYRSHFTKPRLLFEACFHIAYVLREWLPKNPGLSYRATLQQVVEQSILGRYPLTTKFLIENFKFIASQMGSLGDEYGGNWLNSAFFKQLQRMHDSYLVRTAKAEKAKAESEAKRLQREKEVLDRRQKVEDERLKKDEVRKQKESERLEKKKYPMEDMEVLLELPEIERGTRPPYPATPFPHVDIPGTLLGELLMAFQTLVSYKSFIRDCPALEFAQLLVGICGDASAAVLGEVFVPVLHTILEANGPFVASGTDAYGVQEHLHHDKLSIFTWPEVLRAMIRPDEKYIGPIDPLVGCEAVHRILASQPSAIAFLEPVDVEGLGLTDYLDIVTTPMDLGTVKKRLLTGEYETDVSTFYNDVKLIWANAIRYNGEHTDIGKTAMALSELFEAEYARLVVDQNDRLHRRNQAAAADLTAVELHEALRVAPFSQLPLAHRIAALTWATESLVDIPTIRAEIERNVELEFDILRDYRKVERDVEAVRRNADKNRREREDEFRQMCINQGIPTNYNNVFSDATKKKHEFIAEFYTNIANERVAEDAAFAVERKAKEQQLNERLKALSVRFEPLGCDRFHGRYWLFEPGWLFYEWEGAFSVYTDEASVKALLQWLNPKGVREFELKTRLEAAYDTIVSSLDKFLEVAQDCMVPSTSENAVGLPPDTLDAFKVPVASTAQAAYVHALRTLVEYVSENGCAKQVFVGQNEWLASIETPDNPPAALSPLVLEFEQYLFSHLNDDLVQPAWKRKRRDWRSAVQGAATFVQLLVLLVSLLHECFVLDAFVDYVVQLDRKEWLKLRPKPSRNFCPDVDQQVVYFGDGHAQAMKDDRKNKKPVKCDAPVLGATLICRVTHISYHHGSGDPYAMLTLRPEPDAALSRDPGSYLCTSPSSVQKLGRILARIVGKLRAEPDSEPFLDPVSKADFPTYTDIILHPMDLSKISQKIKDGKYKAVDEFVGDVKLMADNCQLFCEGRFPTLPPMARHLVTLCQNLVKKYAAELKVAVGDIAREQRKEAAPVRAATDAAAIPSRLVFIIRLENRLPEYIIDSKRYEAAIRRAWKSGDRVRILYRDPKGNPTEYYSGMAAGSLPFDAHGLLPWEALRITWDEDDGSDNRVNPWEAEITKK